MRKRAEKVLDLLEVDKQDQARDVFELPSTTATLKGEPMAMSIADLKKEHSAKVEYLWRRHIPKGTSCMIEGREESRKTTICLQICKEILEENPEGSVVWLGTEGFIDDTLNKIEILGLTERLYVPKKSDGTYQFNLMNKNDLAEIKMVLDTKIPKPILIVVVDSLSGATLEISENEDRIKLAIVGLNSIVCEQLKSALVWIHHHSKQKTTLKDKFSGHTVIHRNVRRAFAVIEKGAHTRIIKMVKNNLLGTKCSELISMESEDQIDIYEIGEDTDGTQAKAEALLIGLFKNDNKIRARDAIQEADNMGISKKILHKVKSKLGIESQKLGLTWIWVWSLKR